MQASILPLLIALFSCWTGPVAQAQSGEEQAVKQAIDRFFSAMKQGDTSLLRAQLLPGARLHTTSFKASGESSFREESIEGFIRSVAGPHPQALDERLLSYDIRVDDNLATAWTDYAFYLGPTFSHCGVNAFQLIKQAGQWKILQISDTRRKKNCESDPSPQLDTLLNRWHRAAAQADEDTFFGLMTADGVYIGTDETEYWKRDELRKWSEKYFARDSAWTFHPFERHLYLSDDRQTAWWDEKLHTGMGLCRGSGTLTWTAEGWRIRQFVLSLAVPNDKLKDFMGVMKGRADGKK